MLPKQLTIQGLYSYQEKQVIDFSKLTEAGIFGIFGAVGSGKSSILEAIGFALYGKTERLNDRENRNYNMMNLKSNELLIDFEFEHHDHTIYRFAVKGKRNSKRFQDVKTFDRSAYKLENEEWIPLASADATNILDLSYDNFRRTIIIPQGKFQEFLQLGNSDRTKMMMDIFHLHKYDLSDKVRNLESENELNIANLQGQAASYNHVDEAALLTKKEQLAEVQSKETALQSNITKQETVFQELSKLKEQFDTLNQYNTDCLELEKQKGIFEERRKKLTLFQEAKLYFEPSLQRKKVLASSIDQRNNQLQQSNTTLANTRTDIETQTQYWHILQNDYSKLDIWQQQVQEFQIAQDILNYKQQAHDTQEKIIAGKIHIDKQERNKTQFEQLCSELEKSIQEKKQNQPSNIFIFNEIGEWFHQKKNLQSQIADWHKQITAQQERIAKGKSLFPALSFHFENWQQESEIQKTQYRQAIADLQKEKNKLALKSELHQYAQNLQEGNPCPLCGAIHHPNKLEDNATIAQELAKIDAKLASANNDLSLLESNIVKATRYTSEINTCEEQIKTFSTYITQQEQSLREHQSNFIWKSFDAENENDFILKKQYAEKNLAEINQLETALSQQKKQLENCKETLFKYQNALIERQAQYNAAQDNAQKLIVRLQLISPSAIDQYNSAQYAQQKTDLENKISYTKTQYESLQKRLQDLDKNQAILIAEIQSIELEKEKELSELEHINLHIGQLLQKHQIESEENIWEIFQQDINIQTETTTIQQYQAQLLAAQQKRAQLTEQLENKKFDETQWRQQQEDLQTSKNTLTNYTATIAQLTQTIMQLQTDLEKKKQIQKQLQEKQLRKDNIQTLKSLFREQGFVNYISSVYLKNLCLAANDRFSKLTHNQLHLELNENNEFLIRDLLNDGKTRSAKTLSGGQTFQASLSLALALADSIQYQNKSEQNFFFLDEGFGSLDKEALATIYETLKSLRKENRIVGIISHVEDLQQEIPISLFIENNPEKGSQIHFQMS